MGEVHQHGAKNTVDPAKDQPSMTAPLRCAVQRGSETPWGPRLDARTQRRYDPFRRREAGFSRREGGVVGRSSRLVIASAGSSLTPPRPVVTGIQLPPGCNSRNRSAPRRATHHVHLLHVCPHCSVRIPLRDLAPGRSAHFQHLPGSQSGHSLLKNSAPGRSAHVSHLRSSGRHRLGPQLSPTSLHASVSPPVTAVPSATQHLLSPRSRRAS
jgi:hypothetical protein